jgi:hypothetical protein
MTGIAGDARADEALRDRGSLIGEGAARVPAVTRDLYFVTSVLAALAAVLFVIGYDTPACRMSTFVLLSICHDVLPSLAFLSM